MAKQKQDQRCGRCRFWPRYPYAESNDLDDAGLAGSPRSECRRRAPVVGSQGDFPIHPWTDAGHWCGEFEPRAKEPGQ